MGYILRVQHTDPITFDPNFQRDIQLGDTGISPAIFLCRAWWSMKPSWQMERQKCSRAVAGIAFRSHLGFYWVSNEKRGGQMIVWGWTLGMKYYPIILYGL